MSEQAASICRLPADRREGSSGNGSVDNASALVHVLQHTCSGEREAGRHNDANSRTKRLAETIWQQRPPVSGQMGMTSNQAENENNNAPHPVEGDERLPEHLRAPEGVPQDVHEINLLLTAMLMGAQATYFWLNTKRPNVDAARRSSMRLHKQQTKLNALFNAIADQQPDRR